jgi:urease accessory protein
MNTIMRMAETALYDLMSWMSPAWPIGAFAHSGGLEWAVEAGHVTDRAGCADWIADLIARGAVHNDAVLFVHAWRAAVEGDAGRLRDVAELAAASQTGFERRLEATAQGAAFRKIALGSMEPPRSGEGSRDAKRRGGEGSPQAPWSAERPLQQPAAGPAPRSGEEWHFASLLAAIDDDDLTYPVAAAALFATNGIALPQALTAWLHGAAANLVSAAQRLVPLGQTDGQRVLRDLRGPIFAAVEAALALPDGDPFDQLGGATLLAELGCMAHETQYTRLFRT